MKHTIPIALTVLLLATAALWWRMKPPAFTDACIETGESIALCAASNMARFSRQAPIKKEHNDFDLARGSVKLVAARNESIGFQLIFRTLDATAPDDAEINIGHWQGPTIKEPQPEGILNSSATPNRTYPSTKLAIAHYHWVKKGGYKWGPKSQVLPWPAAYPDALIPQHKNCAGEQQTLFDNIAMPSAAHHNQAVWLETYVPHGSTPGQYSLPITVNIGNEQIRVDVTLTVYNTTLPDTPSIDAIGELYRTYRLEGAGEEREAASWQAMSHCYQQIAHQHRMVFLERSPELPQASQWDDYVKTYTPMLTGELFTDAYGYSGTGANTPVSVWRTPWPQEFNVTLEAPLTDDDFSRYATMASQWEQIAKENNWLSTRFFAYVFDEVDGPKSTPTNIDEATYVAMVHEQMDKLQKAIDTGTELTSLDLLWTSHSNPAKWLDKPALDLSDKVRLWSPNAGAADPSFLQTRIAAGDRVWFYHSGHPAVGVHSINASGIEMRTWGVIGAKYGIQGQLMWAVNLGSDERPFAEPSYKPDDDRFGNGVLVYPGNQLDKIGYPKAPGPIPSMRLKAWHRGLQDAELYLLALENKPDEAVALMNKIMPVALADASGNASWSSRPADWIEFRKQLLDLASFVSD